VPTKLAILTSLLAACCAMRALADEPAVPDAAALFAQLDLNKDGQISADEVPQEQRRLFERLVRSGDQNKDGKLAGDEFAKALSGHSEKSDSPDSKRPEGGRPDADNPRRAERLFKRLDANSDGKVVADEVPAERREMFVLMLKRGDKDGDGALSREEFLQVRPGGEKQPGNTEKTPDGENKPDAEKPPNLEKRPEGRPGAEQLFRRMDRNGDGKVTTDEVPEERREFVSRLIKRVDKNCDDAMTAEEFAAAPFPGRPNGQAGAGRPPRPEGRPPQGAPAGGLFRALDADRDGKLSGDEIKASTEVILKLDTNGDGVVTVDELLPAGGEGRANK
jgi:Ca2+-binding EF-hand superfamily protein